MLPPPIHPVPPTAPKQYFGKYRGLVTNNTDPMMLGRILAQVPSVPSVDGWASPCLPYLAHPSGTLVAPPVGTSVWIEFEEGNVDFPIWSGCFWTVGHPPLM
jgi:Type VI secretion system/phage-baseplate injector OB domain